MGRSKGMGHWEISEFKKTMGLTPDLFDYFNDTFYNKLNKLVGKKITIMDYDVSIGNYEFDFTIDYVNFSEPYVIGDPIHVGIEVILDGSVTLLNDEDEMVEWDINVARKGSDLWEVNHEVEDIIEDVLYELIPEDRLTNLIKGLHFI